MDTIYQTLRTKLCTLIRTMNSCTVYTVHCTQDTTGLGVVQPSRQSRVASRKFPVFSRQSTVDCPLSTVGQTENIESMSIGSAAEESTDSSLMTLAIYLWYAICHSTTILKEEN